METFTKTVRAVQLNTPMDCRQFVAKQPGAALIKDRNRIDGIFLPASFDNIACRTVLLGQWAVHSRGGGWKRLHTMDGWDHSPA